MDYCSNYTILDQLDDLHHLALHDLAELEMLKRKKRNMSPQVDRHHCSDLSKY